MKNIMITGAKSGIGKALTEILSPNYFNRAVLLDIDEIGISDSNYICYQVDVSNDSQMEEVFYDLAQKDILITHAFNAAGVAGPNKPFHTTRVSEAQKVMDVNFFGTMISMRHQIKMMLRAGNGKIINMSSVLADCALPGSSIYAASKAAIKALSNTIAIENAENAITINTLSPGAVDTGFIDTLKKRVGEENLSHLHPVKRISTAIEIANYAKFILENDTSFMTGTDIKIDGGYSAK